MGKIFSKKTRTLLTKTLFGICFSVIIILPNGLSKVYAFDNNYRQIKIDKDKRFNISIDDHISKKDTLISFDVIVPKDNKEYYVNMPLTDKKEEVLKKEAINSKNNNIRYCKWENKDDKNRILKVYILNPKPNSKFNLQLIEEKKKLEKGNDNLVKKIKNIPVIRYFSTMNEEKITPKENEFVNIEKPPIVDWVDEDAISEATNLVERAERSQDSNDFSKALEIVNKLEDSIKKDRLSYRLSNLRDAMQKEPVEQASKAVQKAEENSIKEDIEEAFRLVNNLEEGIEKQYLLNRLYDIEQQNENKGQALKALKKAEKSKELTDYNDALTSVMQMEDGDEKEELLKNLDKIQASIVSEQQLISDANIALNRANQNKTKKNYEDAKSSINKLSNGKDKKDLLKKLSEIKIYLDKQNKAMSNDIKDTNLKPLPKSKENSIKNNQNQIKKVYKPIIKPKKPIIKEDRKIQKSNKPIEKLDNSINKNKSIKKQPDTKFKRDKENENKKITNNIKQDLNQNEKDLTKETNKDNNITDNSNNQNKKKQNTIKIKKVKNNDEDKNNNKQSSKTKFPTMITLLATSGLAVLTVIIKNLM